MNSLVLICGSVRTGKSYDGIRLGIDYAESTNKKFSIAEQCSFDLMPFFKWSKISTDSLYILDEVGNTLNAQDWFQVQSKIMRNFIFAQGFRRNVLIVILPSALSLMKSIRYMMNYIVETRQQGSAKWFKMIMSYSTGKGKLWPMGNINFSMPPADILKEYETLKREWNNRELQSDIEYMQGLKETKYYTLPKKDLDNAAKKGIIDSEKYINDLTSKGYKRSDAELMFKLVEQGQDDRFEHFCSKCSYGWKSANQNPRQCPNCNSRNWYGKKTRNDDDEVVNPVGPISL